MGSQQWCQVKVDEKGVRRNANGFHGFVRVNEGYQGPVGRMDSIILATSGSRKEQKKLDSERASKA